MPDDTDVDTGESAGSSNDSGESGGASVSAGTEATTDWKAKAKELEKQLARATGKAGAEKAALTEQLTALNKRASEAEAKASKLERRNAENAVMFEVLSKAPHDNRGLFELAAKGILPELEDLSDTPKAAEAVLSRIKERAPATSVNPMPHVQVGDSGQPGVAFTSSGKRLF